MNNQRRRFRPRQQKSSFRRRVNNASSGSGTYFHNNGVKTNSHLNRNGYANNPFSMEKAIQKYQQLGKDALSSGDPVLSENYFQHAEHFSRRLNELNVKSKDSTLVKENENLIKEKEIKTNNS